MGYLQALRDIAAQMKRIADSMATLADSITHITSVVTEAVQDETTKNALILDLQSQLAQANTDKAAALANAATPEQITALDTQATLLEGALKAVQGATGTPVTP